MSKGIIEVVTELTGQAPVQYSGELKAIRCFIHDDQKPSLVIYPKTQSWFCFPCGQGGDIYRFVSLFKEISYSEAKVFIDGDTNVLQEITETLDGLHVVEDEVNYANELNFSISKYCRDLIYRKPQVTNNVMDFFKKVDLLLQKPVNHVILNGTIKESRKLEDLK